MKQILTAAFLYVLAFTPALASPLYAGLQIDDDSAGLLLGYAIDRTYAVEANYTRSKSRISHAGVTVDTSSTGTGIAGIARFPLKLGDAPPYSLFVKGGYQHTTSTEKCSIPTSATLTLPYDDTITSRKNQALFGAGAEHDFTKNLMGRLGLDFLGGDRSIYVAAIFKF